MAPVPIDIDQHTSTVLALRVTYPRSAKSEHVHQQHGNTSPAFWTVRRPVVREFPNQDRDDQVGNEHDQATPEEQRTTADAVHGPKRAGHTDELHAVKHTGHDELHVVFKAHSLEQSWRIVDESVNADELDIVC